MTRIARAIAVLSRTPGFQNKSALHVHATVAVPTHAERFASAVLPCAGPRWIIRVIGSSLLAFLTAVFSKLLFGN